MRNVPTFLEGCVLYWMWYNHWSQRINCMWLVTGSLRLLVHGGWNRSQRQCCNKSSLAVIWVPLVTRKMSTCLTNYTLTTSYAVALFYKVQHKQEIGNLCFICRSCASGLYVLKGVTCPLKGSSLSFQFVLHRFLSLESSWRVFTDKLMCFVQTTAHWSIFLVTKAIARRFSSASQEIHISP